MDRSEAIIYLKELLSQCYDLSPELVSFDNPINKNSIVYRVQIKGRIAESDKQKVRAVAKKHGLSVQEAPDGFVICKDMMMI